MKFTKIGSKPPSSGSSAPASGGAPASKTIFQLEPHMKIRFNLDGWVEELGKGNEENPPGVILQGLSGSKLDDIFARRFYDLYSRVIIFEIHPRRATDTTNATGTMLFKDLEPDSPMYLRVNKIIELGNQNFKMNLKPLA